MDPIHAKILANPKFHELVAKRNRFSVQLTIVTLAAFAAFVAYAIFLPAEFAAPVSEGGAVSKGMVAGFLELVLCVITTGIYTRRANGEFDALAREALRN